MRGRRTKLLAGGAVILAALAYLVYGGMQTAVVYFVTPTELRQQAEQVRSKALRLGGMVEAGSIVWDARTLALSFRLTDGHTTVPVVHTGAPPDLFAEGTGAIVEGRVRDDGTFQAQSIMAKHSEEYVPPRSGEMPAFQKGRYKPNADAAPAGAAPAGGNAAPASIPPATTGGAPTSEGTSY